MGKVVTREWRKASSAELEIAFVSAFRDNSSFGLNILGPLSLWQCLLFRVKLGTSSFPCNLSFNYSEIINFNWEAQCMRLKFIKVQN